MRKLVPALLAAGGLAILGAAPAEAVGTHHPFCLQGREYPALSNCVWDSLEQCRATASGRLLYCIDNPYYDPGDRHDPRAYRGRNHARSVHPEY